jgi:hypothetical protein
MAIRFRCLACRKFLSIGKGKAGQDMSCPNCNHQQQVPLPASSADGMWDLTFGLAVAAAGAIIVLLWCLAGSPHVGRTSKKGVPPLPPTLLSPASDPIAKENIPGEKGTGSDAGLQSLRD